MKVKSHKSNPGKKFRTFGVVGFWCKLGALLHPLSTMGYQKNTYIILISKMNSFISRRVLLKEMELDFTKMFRETESLYLIVHFKIGASDFKFILSFLLRNEGKYRLQAENHKTWILQCSCHGVCLPTAMQRKENLNGQLGRAKLQLRPTKPESHTQKRCASQKHNCIMYGKSHM